YLCSLLIFILSIFLSSLVSILLLFFYYSLSTTVVYTLSLHDALPIYCGNVIFIASMSSNTNFGLLFLKITTQPQSSQRRTTLERSEEHTSELQSRFDLVCRLLLEKKKK